MTHAPEKTAEKEISHDAKAKPGKSSVEIMFTSLMQTDDTQDTISDDISSELDAFLDAYRNGNFGVRRGKVNFTRAKRWFIVHVLAAMIMTSFTAACVQLLDNNRYGVGSRITYAFSAVVILGDILGLAMACCSCYLLGSIAITSRPLLILFNVRFLALVECTLVATGFVLTIKVMTETQPIADRHFERENLKTFIILCVYLLVSMVVDWLAAVAWLFHWWRWCVCCQCLESCCIFEQGEPLAPGVPDPPTGFLRECTYVCWMINRRIGL